MKMRVRPTPGRRGVDVGMAALGTLIGGFVVWGGVGWLLDQWWGTRLMTPIGVILGMGLGIYALVARVNAAAPVQPAHSGSEAGPAPASYRRETS